MQTPSPLPVSLSLSLSFFLLSRSRSLICISCNDEICTHTMMKRASQTHAWTMSILFIFLVLSFFHIQRCAVVLLSCALLAHMIYSVGDDKHRTTTKWSNSIAQYFTPFMYYPQRFTLHIALSIRLHFDLSFGLA